MSRLFAGPWCGEVGWEIMQWQGHIRTLSNNFDETIIASRPGHEYLYNDFCTQFIPFTPYPYDGNTDCELCNNRTYNEFLKQYMTNKDDVLYPAVRHPRPQTKDDPLFNSQTFIKYGKYIDNPLYKFDLVIHVRRTTKCGTGIRNWPKDNWIEVINYFKNKYNIACIGKNDSSSYINGTEDKLDISLEELANVLASSKLLVGASSGPIHYGALCGIKHLVIVPNVEIKRYTNWNPLNTPFEILGDYGWNPPTNYIIENIERNLNEI